MQRAAVIEDEQLVLRSLLDGHDGVSAKRRKGARRDPPRECGVKQPDSGDGSADDRTADSTRSAFNLRKFRHRGVEG